MTETSPATSEALAKRLDKLYEFEREPISADKLHGGRRFAALFAGEHVAATEFVIGALFVKWGAGASDLIWGLIVGNLLAVLSWAFICTPIAVRVRLTLYWYARRIIGPGLTVVYNIVNAMLYCCLAAAMIGVSASAVILALSKIGLHVEHPKLSDIYPNSVGWVIIVSAVGAVVITLAILGFKKLSQFSQVCAPWMFLVFITGALASLPALGEVNSLADFWDVAETKIWTGEPAYVEVGRLPRLDDTPDDAQLLARLGELGISDPESFNRQLETAANTSVPCFVELPDARYRVTWEGMEAIIATEGERLGFWHLAFFAWFANLAMHVGLSDMALFRYARKWTYGFYSSLGMYLGHFLAWICAGIMGAALGKGLNPGEMADSAAGMVGVLAVLIAGWTTANPTIYRAGLALQIVTPDWPRWKVTLAAGAITTVVGFFPAIFMQLLDFVAIYGLMLMPIGAVIVVEHWLFPRLGLQQYWANRRKIAFNPAALLSWVAVLVLCFPIEQFTQGAVQCPMAMLGVHLFFRWLPGWFIAAGLYIVLSTLFGARSKEGPLRGDDLVPIQPPVIETTGDATPSTAVQLRPIAWIAGGAAALSLAFTLALAIIVFLGGADPAAYEANLANYKTWAMVATIVYFIAAIVWSSEREKVKSKAEVA